MKIFISLLMYIVCCANFTVAAEIIVGKCERTQSVISKVKSLETNGGNEFMHMAAKNVSQAILIHTYDKKSKNIKDQ